MRYDKVLTEGTTRTSKPSTKTPEHRISSQSAQSVPRTGGAEAPPAVCARIPCEIVRSSSRSICYDKEGVKKLKEQCTAVGAQC